MYVIPCMRNQTKHSDIMISHYTCPGQTSCNTQCPAGYECPSNADAIECAAGQYSALGDKECTPCASGYYSSTTGRVTVVSAPSVPPLACYY